MVGESRPKQTFLHTATKYSKNTLRKMNAINVTKGPAKASSPNAERRTPNAFSPLFPDPIQVIRPDLILVDYGPMTLTISAWADGKPRPVMAARAAVLCAGFVGGLSAVQPLLKTPAGKDKKSEGCPSLLRKAVRACRAVSSELTGLAAVAGLTADEVLKEALRLGADRVIVNNGGDIALFTSGRQRIKVGLKTHPAGRGHSLFRGRKRRPHRRRGHQRLDRSFLFHRGGRCRYGLGRRLHDRRCRGHLDCRPD